MKNNNQQIDGIASYVGWLLLLSALGFYGYGITKAVLQTVSGEIKYHEFLLATIGSIQALLLANLGVVLGIKVAKPDSNIARSISFKWGSNTGGEPIPPMEIKEKIQLIALSVYSLSLVVCFITWIVKDFTVDPTMIVSVIPESGKMFIGVVLAYLSTVLSK